jgi:hypothetical protein
MLSLIPKKSCDRDCAASTISDVAQDDLYLEASCVRVVLTLFMAQRTYCIQPSGAPGGDDRSSRGENQQQAGGSRHGSGVLRGKAIKQRFRGSAAGERQGHSQQDVRLSCPKSEM